MPGSNQRPRRAKVINTPGFEGREGYTKMTFKSVVEPKFTFIKVPEFDLRHLHDISELGD